MRRAASTRALSVVWWMFTLVLIATYTANLAAFLSVEHMELPIRSADDLSRQTTIKYGSVSNGSTQMFFEVGEASTYTNYT